ncbi:MAG: YvcK family protein [Chloroflexi bacterium]|nr:YvcK family protein [Chloroflexota bacterium]
MRARNGSGRASGWQTFIKFAYAGLGVKRWILLWSAGVGIIAIGLAFVSKNVFDLFLPNFLPWYLEGVLLGGVGVAAVAASVFGLYRSVGHVVLATSGIDSLADTLYTRRYRSRGPRIVTIGGGTGMSVLLRGLKEHTDNISAIVTVGDDGGSSGRLRENFGVLPPGDFRNCLIALSDDETLVRDLFQYRFDRGEGLEGHSFGNLFIAAMTDITGNFEAALEEFSRVLAVHGRVLPATNESLQLSAKLFDGTVVDGESNIGTNGGVIRELMIRPPDASAVPGAIQAILDAEIIVIGPGSLYTSILPNLLVKGLAEAVLNTEARKLYVCNVATEHGETIGYTVADHLSALQQHTSSAIVDYVIANSGIAELGPPFKGRLVEQDGSDVEHARIVTADLIDREFPVRHDAAKLADSILAVYHRGVPEAETKTRAGA